jgi:DNA-binding winged helix-turn-helix (wHTH) protein/tetratricopeptide (TPR) repeat protein
MTVSERVELAHEPDFTLGRLTVSPSRREVARDDGEREVVEHRVMQVLVALSRARGGIVTRDELITSCWDGRIVGEDSIHRALSRLRKVASGIGAGSIEIETITKIGYRLTSDQDGAADGGSRAPEGVAEGALEGADVGPARPTRQTRRGLLIGAGVLGVLAAGGGGLLLTRRPRGPAVPPEVQALVIQARQLRDQNTREAQQQAIGLMRRVVAMAPDYADGWGMLGCAYAIPSHYRARAEGIDLRARAEAAARRALELDTGNGYGELALSIALPFIGHWLERDRRLERALSDRPDDDEMLTFRAVALIFVGRSREALSYYDRIRHRPLRPAAYNNYIRALWSAGRVEETDRAMDDAGSLYPSQETIWITRFHIAMFGDRPGDAIALAEDAPGRPSGIDGDGLTAWLAQARALESRDPGQIEAVRGVQMERARVSAFGAEYAIRMLSALGRIDDAFAVAQAYYFARGFTVPDQFGPAAQFTPDQRQTRLLFEPVTRPMRADSRFEALVEEIGLDRYWRESGIPPDYRRA